MEKKVFGYESFFLFHQGDPKGLIHFYAHYRRYIEIWLISFPIKSDLKEDITHETLIKALERRTTFKDISHLQGWLKKVAIYAAISCVRKDISERNKMEGSRYLSDLIELGASLEEEHTQLHQRLFKSLSALPQISREIIVLFFYQDKSNSEIARRLNLTVNAVVARKSRALKFLRQDMGDPGFG